MYVIMQEKPKIKPSSVRRMNGLRGGNDLMIGLQVGFVFGFLLCIIASSKKMTG